MRVVVSGEGRVVRYAKCQDLRHDVSETTGELLFTSWTDCFFTPGTCPVSEAVENRRATMRGMRLALVVLAWRWQKRADAQDKKNGPGVTDSEIMIGHSAPFSGPASAFGIYSRVEEAYFNAVNDKGGINSARSSSSPSTTASARPRRSRRRASWSRRTTCWPRSAPSARRPIRRPSAISTARSAAAPDLGWRQQVQRSQAVSLDGAVLPLVRDRGDRLRRYALKAQTPKIGVLYQNDDNGKDFLKGLKKALGDN